MKRFVGVLSTIAVVTLLADVVWSQPPAGQRGRGPGRGFMPPVFSAIDPDGDGEISAQEMADAAKALAELDKNSDGKLSREEYLARPGFGGGAGGAGGARRPSGGGEVAFQSRAIPKDDAEKKILAVLDEMDQNERGGMMNVPAEDGRLLRLLAESLEAKNVVEIGTSNGYSGIWFSLALRKTGGKLTTHEIDAGRASLARKNFARAGVEDLITLVEGDAHEEVKKLSGPIDLLFLDADKEGYIDYLGKLLPKLRPGGLIVAHNMNTRQAHPPFVEAITTNPDLETLFLHMDQAGVAVSMKKR